MTDPNEPEVAAGLWQMGECLYNEWLITSGRFLFESDGDHIHFRPSSEILPGGGLTPEFKLIGRIAGFAHDDEHLPCLLCRKGHGKK